MGAAKEEAQETAEEDCDVAASEDCAEVREFDDTETFEEEIAEVTASLPLETNAEEAEAPLPVRSVPDDVTLQEDEALLLERRAPLPAALESVDPDVDVLIAETEELAAGSSFPFESGALAEDTPAAEI